MPNILLVKDGVCLNAIVAESADRVRQDSPDLYSSFDAVVAEPAATEQGTPGIGWSYADGVWAPPPPPTP